MLKVLPLFLGTILRGLHVVISDGDPQIIDAINFCIGNGVFPSATVRLLCFWHTVILVINEELGLLGKEVCGVIKGFLNRIAIESDHKEVKNQWGLLFQYLEKYVNSDAKLTIAKDVLEKIQTFTPPSLVNENPLVQPDFENIVKRMLEKDLTRRYKGVFEVIAEIEVATDKFGIDDW